MKKLVIFPGLMDAVFLTNEYDFYRKKFDKIIVLTNPGEKKSFDSISQKFDIDYRVVKTFSPYSIFSFLCRMLISPKDRKLVINDIRRAKKNSSFTILFKRILYIFMYMCFAINAEKAFRETTENTDQVVIYSYWLSRGAFAASYINDKRIIKKISRAHRYDLYEDKNPVRFLPFRTHIKTELDKIFFISEDGRSYFKTNYGGDDTRYTVNYLGTQNKHNYRKEIKEKSYITVVSCSNIVDVKRLDLIIQALKELDISYKWYHIGDGVLMQEIQDLAQRSLSKTSYTFLGKVDNKDILKTYMDIDADFLINLSDSEGVPVSIMEAMSIGLPVIVRNVGGCSEIVNEDCGLLLENGYQDEQIRNFIGIRFNDIQRYIELSENAYGYWKSKFDANHNYTEFAELLANCK